LTDI
jgi:hypothetical protein